MIADFGWKFAVKKGKQGEAFQNLLFVSTLGVTFGIITVAWVDSRVCGVSHVVAATMERRWPVW